MTPPPPGYRYQPAPPRAPNGLPLAEYGDRALAFIIDFVILTAITFLLWIPAWIYQFSLMDDLAARLDARLAGSDTAPDLAAVYGEVLRVFAPVLLAYGATILAVIGVYYIYRVEMMFRSGQTVGKRVMSLRVMPLDPAAVLTRGMAVRRWLMDSVGALLVSPLFWVDGLWQYWDKPFRQCLHDKVAGTTVVRAYP